MNREDGLDALQFEDQVVIDQQIHSLAAIEEDTLVLDWQRQLHSKRNFRDGELMREALSAGRLEKSRPKVAMNFNGAADHSLG